MGKFLFRGYTRRVTPNRPQAPKGSLTPQQMQSQLQNSLGYQKLPYARVPTSKFWTRIAVPAVLVLTIGFFLMGSFAILSRMSFNAEVREKDPTRIRRSSMLPHKAAFQQIEDFTDAITHIPQICWAQQASSDFQRAQCADFWNNLMMDGVIGSVPFLMLGFFLIWAFDALSKAYLRVRRQIAHGQALFSGLTTQPPLGKNDFFGWFFCFRSIVVQIKGGQQVRVYMPLYEPLPPSGIELTIYGGFRRWGSVRLFGVYYPAGVQVIKGQ